MSNLAPANSRIGQGRPRESTLFGFKPGTGGNADGGYLAQASAIFAAFNPSPTDARKSLINSLVGSLIGASVWEQLDAFWVLGAAASQNASINWKTPGTFTLTIGAGSPTFTTDRGYTGDGTSAYLDSGYNFGSASVGISQNDGHASAFTLTNGASVGADVGTTGSSTRLQVIARSGISANVVIATATSLVGIAGVNVPCLVTAIRRDPANQFLHRNGVQEATSAVASAAYVSANFAILGTLPVPTFTDRQVAFASIGKQLSDAQSLAMYNAILKYLQAIGAA